jgi:hypothetical protein
VTVPVLVEREMGCTRADLARWLAGATRSAGAHLEGDELALAVGSGRVEISVREETPRRVALLAIPVLRVRFRFVGLGASAREEFMAHFDSYTRRGGG